MQSLPLYVCALVTALPPAQNPITPGPSGPGGAGPNAVLGEGLTDEDGGRCIRASSQPRRGHLYPLSLFLNVDLAGRVGMGTTTPLEQLHVQGGDVLVSGELVTTWGGDPAVQVMGSASTGSGGALILRDALGTATVTVATENPAAPGTVGWFELLDQSTGDAVQVLGKKQSVGAAGRLDLLFAGSLRASLNAMNSTGIVFTPQLELWNRIGKSTVQLSGSHLNGTGRITVSDSAGNPRAELTSDAGANLTLWSQEGTISAELSGTSDVQAPQAVLRNGEGDATLVVQSNFEDSGAGHVTLGVGGGLDTVFVDGGSGAPEVLINQKDGTLAVELSADPGAGGPRGSLRMTNEAGGGLLELTRAWGPTPHFGWLAMYLAGGERVVNVGPGPLGPGIMARTSGFHAIVDMGDFGGWGALQFDSADEDREAFVGLGGITLFDAMDNVSLSWSASTGSKAAVVGTESFGRRHLYVREGTGGWFEEAGVHVVRDGFARIELDPLFLEVVTIDAEHPLRVFATPHADAALQVEVDERGFWVRTEVPGGAPGSVAFSWVAQATRRGFEGLRLEPHVEADPDSPEALGQRANLEAGDSRPLAPVARMPRRPAALTGVEADGANDPAAGPAGGSTPPGPPLGPEGPPVADLLRDVATGSGRIAASSVPTIGCLYPMTSELYVDAAGPVGIGTTSPDHLLTIAGGDVLVEGGLRVGLPGSEDFLVSEGSDGLPTLLLRDGSGDPTLTIGESALSGTRAGLELVDPGTGRALFTSAGTNGVELTDAQTGALALRLGSNELSAFSDSEVRTLLLAGGPGPVEAQLFDPSGVEAVRLDSDPGGFGGARLSLRGSPGGDTLEVGRRLLSSDESNVATRLAVGNSVELSTSASVGVADAGSLVVRDGAGQDTIQALGLGPTGGAELVLNDGLDDRVRLLAKGAFGAPSLEIVDPGALVLASVNGQSGIGDSGSLAFNDGTTGFPVVTIEGDVGGGGVVSVLDPGGAELVRLDAGLGGFFLRDDTGALYTRFQGTVLDLMDASGAVTISYDGATGAKNGVVATEDYGSRRLYAIESPEVWFEDSGHARLEGGSVRVELDAVFLETITISEREPLLVFVTPTAACEGLWVEPHGAGFTVHERSGGVSRATFDWRVLARRRGAEGKRLEPWTRADERTQSKAEEL